MTSSELLEIDLSHCDGFDGVWLKARRNGMSIRLESHRDELPSIERTLEQREWDALEELVAPLLHGPMSYESRQPMLDGSVVSVRVASAPTVRGASIVNCDQQAPLAVQALAGQIEKFLYSTFYPKVWAKIPRPPDLDRQTAEQAAAERAAEAVEASGRTIKAFKREAGPPLSAL